MKRVLLIIGMLFCVPVIAAAQQAGRARQVATRPSEPCNPRDFVAADDTGISSLCNPLTRLWGNVDTNSATGTANQVVKFSSSAGLANSGRTDTSTTITDKLTETAPTAASVALAGAGAGNVTNGAHTVKVTCVTAAGQTTAGTASSAATVVDNTVNGKIAISSIPLCSYLATGRKVYMATVAAPTVYKLLSNGTIADNTTTTLTANDSDATLGASTTAPSTNTAIDARLTIGQSAVTVAVPATLSSTLTVTGHTILEGVTSTGATGTGKLVYDTGPTIASPVINSAAHVGGTWVADAAWTLPALTFGGTVTGGSQSLNSIGHIGILRAADASTGLIYVGSTASGTQYGVDVEVTGAAASNVGGYFAASGATANTALVVAGTTAGAGQISINQTGTAVNQFAGAMLFSGLTTAAGTPNSICQNSATKEITVNAALSCTVSHPKFKDNILPFTGGLEMVRRMKPKRFVYKDNPARVRLGFLSTQLQSVDPRLADGYDAQGEAQSIDLPGISAANTGAIQELDSKFESYKAATDQRILSLEKENARLRRMVRRKRDGRN